MMKIDILTLFPEMFTGVLGSSILKRAAEKQIASYQVINFRDFSTDKHQTVDDYPYGGGPGMVLKAQPIFDAVAHVKEAETAGKNPRIILLCPQGETYSQRKAEELAKEDHLIFICGHYEGYDERIRQHLVTDEISIGDFVLTGGELGAMVMIDSIVRLLPGALGNKASALQESFSTPLLDYPHYTRPANFRDMEVPEVLLNGHHKKIEEWRKKQALQRTFQRRPDLLCNYELTEQERKWLKELTDENGSCIK